MIKTGGVPFYSSNGFSYGKSTTGKRKEAQAADICKGVQRIIADGACKTCRGIVAIQSFKV